MTLQTELSNRISDKQKEVIELEARIREARAYIRALQDVHNFIEEEFAKERAATVHRERTALAWADEGHADAADTE
jgi:hypothetical protein